MQGVKVESRYTFTSRKFPARGTSLPPFEENNLAVHVGDDRDRVLANRGALADSLALHREQLFFMNQVHGSTILEIDGASDANMVYECDGLITRTPGIGLAVLVADCAPVLLIGRSTVAAIHVGWRGLFDGIVEKALALMADGNLPGRGRYGDAVGRALEYVLEHVTESGLVSSGEPTDRCTATDSRHCSWARSTA